MASRPEYISGGCVCGAIRYKISFPEEKQWPPQIATCQCTLCRKWTGCLMSHDMVLKPSQVTPDFSTLPTFKEYASSEWATRGFCTQCGSSLSWRVLAESDMLVVFTGTLDEEVLIGKIVTEKDTQTETGVKSVREGGFAKELCTPNIGCLYWNNAVPGVTDHDFGCVKFMQSFPQE